MGVYFTSYSELHL